MKNIILLLCLFVFSGFCRGGLSVVVYVNINKIKTSDWPSWKENLLMPTEKEKEMYLYQSYGEGKDLTPFVYLTWFCEIFLKENPERNFPIVEKYIIDSNHKYLAFLEKGSDEAKTMYWKKKVFYAVRALYVCGVEKIAPMYMNYLKGNNNALYLGARDGFHNAIQKNVLGFKPFILQRINDLKIKKRKGLVEDLFFNDVYGGFNTLWTIDELNLLFEKEKDKKIKEMISSNLLKMKEKVKRKLQTNVKRERRLHIKKRGQK